MVACRTRSVAALGAGKNSTQIPPVGGSTTVQLATGVTIVRPPATVPAGEQFFSGPAPSCAVRTIGRKLQAGTTRCIQYQVVPKKQGGKRKKVFYKVTVQS
jgi:hypothetical protein